MKRMYASHGICTLVGFSLAWFASQTMISKEKDDYAATAELFHPRLSVSRSHSAHKTSTAGRIQSYLEQLQIAEKSGNREELDAALGKIPLEYLLAIIDVWKKNASFSGLDDNKRSLILDLFCKWYEKDPQRTLELVKEIAPEKDQDLVVSAISESLLVVDYHQALTFAQRNLSKGQSIPSVFFSKMSEFDAKQLMEVLRAFPATGSVTGADITFKSDFDFAAMGQMLVEDKAASTNGSPLYSSFPSNFLSSWAALDYKAAWDWIVSNRETAPFQGIDSVLQMVHSRNGKAVANQLVFDHFHKIENKSEKYRFALEALDLLPKGVNFGFMMPTEGKVDIDFFIKSVGGQRLEHYTGLLESAYVKNRGWYDLSIRSLLEQMTPEERIYLLPQLIMRDEKDFMSDLNRKYQIETLSALGHTKEEIEVMVPAAPSK